jgi:ferredoxin
MPSEKLLKGVSLNLIACHGCGACAQVAPELFAMDPDTERPFLLAPQGPEDLIRQAMAYCPNDCIEIEE